MKGLSEWHLITSEYPPQAGGVSDYTQLVAKGLAAAGDAVHVWCPAVALDGLQAEAAGGMNGAGVSVHRELGRIAPADLRRVGRLLDGFSQPRRLLVQWVPHGYGYQSMNVPFCAWLWNRAARRGDVVEVMVHEPYLSFDEGSWKQSGVAAVHRLMTIMLLKAASRVWISIPAWEDYWRPYSLGRALPFHWLPVTSNIAVVDDPARVASVRARYAPASDYLLGHFGTYDPYITAMLLQTLPALFEGRGRLSALLLGRGSEAALGELLGRHPNLSGRVHATGELDAAALSLHLSACDVMLQPYVDGVSSRRTSVMVGLSHGLPIVTTSGKLTERLWAESEAVALVPIAEAARLAEATWALLSDEPRRRRMSAAARSLYAERFTVERTVAALSSAA